MEKIERTIQLKKKKEFIDENQYILVVDDSVIYNTKILLKNKSIDVGFFDVVPFFNVSTNSIDVGSNGVAHFFIETNLPWKIRKTVDWIVLDNYEGKNDKKIVLNLGVNNTNKSRVGELIITPQKNIKEEYIIIVTQPK